MDECSECFNDPNWTCWRDEPMNEKVRERLQTLPPKMFHLSFESAAKAWCGEVYYPE